MKVKAIKEFWDTGLIRFNEGDVLEVSEKWDRHFLSIPKRSNKIMIPEGYVREATEEEIKEFEDKQEEDKK